jgi:hypothetical protein
MVTFIALLIGVLLQGSAVRMEYVPFCEIVQHPERYDQTSVLTSGIYQVGPEFSEFLDPDCPSAPGRDVGTLPVPSSDRVLTSGGWRRMNQVLNRENRAFIVIRGVFDAYNRYEGPVPADPQIEEILRKGNSRFGHMNFARFRLRIESVEFVSSVSAKASQR